MDSISHVLNNKGVCCNSGAGISKFIRKIVHRCIYVCGKLNSYIVEHYITVNAK